MKKLFSLTAGLLVAMVMFAAAPTVTINVSSSEYEVRVDGKTYSNTNGNTIRITDIGNGSHTIKVYRAGTGIFRTKRLVSEQTFNVQNNDVRINVDRDGNINVRESAFRNKSDDRSFENNSDRRSRGNGNKYGHNKEWKKKKAKKNKDWKDRDDDDDDDDDDRRNSRDKDDNDDRWKRTDRRSTRS